MQMRLGKNAVSDLLQFCGADRKASESDTIFESLL